MKTKLKRIARFATTAALGVAVTWTLAHGRPSAAQPTQPHGSAERLIQASHLVRDNWRLSDQAFEPNNPPDSVLELKNGPLDPVLTQAVAGLLAWHKQAGTLVEAGQPPRYHTIALLQLGRLALASASGPEDPRVEATLRLSFQLRHRSDLLSFMIGHHLARATAERFLARGWTLPERFWRLRPTLVELYPSLVHPLDEPVGPHLSAITRDIARWESLRPAVKAPSGSDSERPGR